MFRISDTSIKFGPECVSGAIFPGDSSNLPKKDVRAEDLALVVKIFYGFSNLYRMDTVPQSGYEDVRKYYAIDAIITRVTGETPEEMRIMEAFHRAASAETENRFYIKLAVIRNLLRLYVDKKKEEV